MKRAVISILTMIIVLLSAGHSALCAPVRLTIRLRSVDPVVMYQYKPLDGVCIIPTDTITLFGDTTFIQEIQMDVKGAAPYCISARTKRKYDILNMIIESGNKIEISYSPDSVGGFRIANNSSNARGQRVYNDLLKTYNIYKYEWGGQPLTTAPLDTIGDVMYANFQALARADQKQFDDLHDKGMISTSFRDFAMMDIEYYYVLSMAKVIRSNFLDAIMYDSVTLCQGYGELIEMLCEKYPLNSKSIRSTNAIRWANIYIDLRPLIKDPNAQLPNYATQGQYFYSKLDNFDKQISPQNEVIRPLMAQFIWLAALNNKYFDPAVDSLIDEFNIRFRNNQYQPYFERFTRESQRFRRIMASPLSDKVQFIQDTAGISKLSEIFDKFKGKDIYVDFWYSSCGPCKEEFKYAERTYKFLEENNITPVFISVDSPERHKNWLNAIKYYNLEGQHICVNKITFQDMDSKYGIHLFPRYMIVDKSGRIVESRAKAPSEGEELFMQLKEKLGK